MNKAELKHQTVRQQEIVPGRIKPRTRSLYPLVDRDHIQPFIVALLKLICRNNITFNMMSLRQVRIYGVKLFRNLG